MIRLGLMFLVVAGSLHGQSKDELSPVQAQALIQEWVKTERLLSEEVQDWEAQRENLNDLLELYEKEISLLTEESKAAGESVEAEDKERVRLKSEVEARRAERAVWSKQVVKLSERMLNLSRLFPEPLQEMVGEDLAVLAGVKDEKQLREGLVAVVSVLKQAGNFNRVVTVKEQVSVSEGKSRMMKVMYLGLGYAYYVSGDVGGVGRYDGKKWVWEERDGMASKVSKALAIFNGTAQPELVELPVEVAQ